MTTDEARRLAEIALAVEDTRQKVIAGEPVDVIEALRAVRVDVFDLLDEAGAQRQEDA